jgi:hypothetical protein
VNSFFIGQELAAGGEPFRMRNNVWVSYFYRAASHRDFPWTGANPLSMGALVFGIEAE